MRQSCSLLLIALSLAFIASRQARADGLTAPSLAVNDGYSSTASMHIAAMGGTDGVSEAFTAGMAFEYVSYYWGNQSLEAGAGVRFHVVPPLQMYVAAGGIIQPLYRPEGGGRITGGLTAQFGDTFFVRPGFAFSFGLIGAKLPPTYFLPLEASLEIGYQWPVFSIYARVGAGLDALQKPTAKTFGRVEGDIGFNVPINAN